MDKFVGRVDEFVFAIGFFVDAMIKVEDTFDKPFGTLFFHPYLLFYYFADLKHKSMGDNKITVNATILVDINKVWNNYTLPEHITRWNFADPSWHCPKASNELKIGGRYFARMEARDGSFGFDFEAVYSKIKEGESFTYGFGGREATVHFKENNGTTEVSITFDPETENSIELQKNGWQAILNNFKTYTETSG